MLPFISNAGRWTSEEDAALLESVAKYGKRWYEVARALPGRTDDQCAKRYKDAVDPSIRECNSPPLLAGQPIVLAGRDPWTAEEDERLWSAFEKHGNKWHTIANTLQGRPGQFILATRGGIIPIDGLCSYPLSEPPAESPAGQGNS